MTEMKVAQLHRISGTDIVGQLRCIAAAIETGALGTPDMAAFVFQAADRDEPQVFGWGYAPVTYTTAGLLLRAAQIAAQGRRGAPIESEDDGDDYA